MNIDFKSIESIREAGFKGFKTIDSLWEDNKDLPRERGVYLILRINDQTCEYLEQGTGGFFKERNPNVSLIELQNKWVRDSSVVYIGKAGGVTGKATLFSRLNQYLKFGRGKKIGHWGGRFIWQLKDAPELVVCWKTLAEADPRIIEKKLILDFVNQFGKRPFANLVG